MLPAPLSHEKLELDLAMDETSFLVLGTAQLGMPYGLSNRIGQPDDGRATALVKKAWERGIREFDTAQAYGSSEEALGRAIRILRIGDSVKVISKLHKKLDHQVASDLEKSIRRSLDLLGVSRLHGLMLHHESLLDLWERGLKGILQALIQDGLTENLGISVYSPERAVSALTADGINLVQIPSNIFDRRFEQAKVFELARDLGKKIYVRSIFLQGLLLLSVDELPFQMRFAAPIVQKLQDLADQTRLSKKEIALGYVKAAYPEAAVIFGAEAEDQIDENVEIWRKTPPADLIQRIRENFSDADVRIVNPAMWAQR